MYNEEEKQKWIKLIKQVRNSTSESTDWNGISEISQIAMYGAVILFAGAAIFGLAKINQEAESGSTSRRSKKEIV